jgi:peptide chain release factor 3
VNLLDTPGHKDFSEDTYRVLTAVDAAVMVIDAGKGVEPQTRKLFEVCRRRGVPIFTFMNKCDRPTRNPLELVDELERVLGIESFAMNWPIGSGPEFRGVYDRLERQIHLFERTVGGMFEAPVSLVGLDDPALHEKLSSEAQLESLEEIRMLDGAGSSFDASQVLAGRTTPVFFGSAMNNFGVRLLLDSFLRYSSPPTGRRAGGLVIEPTDPRFSGFVFKIQANMDPKHRDRVAFVRIVSGRFERDMFVVHAQSGKRVRLGNAQKLFGNQRETVDDAVAGDVVGLVGNDLFGVGDTLTDDRTIVFNEIPEFTPECFAYLRNPQPSNFKKFRLGLDQLMREGVARRFESVGSVGSAQSRVLLAAVGPLQFEVLKHRLEGEYGAEALLEGAPWTLVRWWNVKGRGAFTIADEDVELPETLDGSMLAYDDRGRAVVLFADQWAERAFVTRNPAIELHALPIGSRAPVAAGTERAS